MSQLPQAPESLHPAATLSQTAQATVLVVDDHAVNRLVLTHALTREGYRVVTADSGEQALARVAEQPVHLVLLDVMMPGMSGLDLLRILRTERPRADLPVIMVTSRDASEDVVEALRAGANDYVTKPVDLAVALARVATQLALKRAKDEVEALNERLRAAQARIDELVASGTQAADDATGWAAAMAPRVAQAIGADSLEISLRGERPTSNTLGAAATISLEDLRTALASGAAVERAAHVIVPIPGVAIEPLGVLIVHGQGDHWDGPARRLVETFARQLGSAIDMQRLRQQLEEAASERRLHTQKLLAQGHDLLRLCHTCGRCFDHRTSHCPDDGRELSAPRGFPYRIAGRYRLRQLRGEGGMGTVYEGFDERLERSVAVKVIRADHFHDVAARGRFRREATVAARIDHPAVVAVYDSGELEDGALYIVMEWLDGSDLADALRRCGPGTPAEVATLVQQIGHGLAAAHAAGLLHRDIKPENVFLVRRPEGFAAKLLDFGVAKVVGHSSGLTRVDAIVGTPRFMSPEQLQQKPLDARSDLYSLAAVAYQALTGRRVTLAEEFADVVFDVVNTVPPPVSALLSGTPHEVDDAMLAALAKRPEDRPASLERWADELAAALGQMAPRAAGWLTPEGELDVERVARDHEAGGRQPTKVDR